MAAAAGQPLPASDCGRQLLRLLSRGHAVTAELHRVADAVPPALLGRGPDAQRLAPVLPDFAVFRSEGAVERVASSNELIGLDQESRELHERFARRAFRLLAAVRKYALDLARFLDELEAGAFVSRSVEAVLRDSDGAQLLPEALALLGSMLLLLDERLPGSARERALVLFYRATVGTEAASDDFPDVCRLFKSTGKPADEDLSSRPAGYPEKYFARFPLPREAVRMVLGRLQTGDIYDAARHYPLPEHRSHSFSAQAGLVYVTLFFDARTLDEDVAAMREIVSRHFSDAWVVAYALGFTADLFAMWAPYRAAREALGSTVTPATVRRSMEQHLARLREVDGQLGAYLKEGVLTEDLVASKTPALLACLRQANTTIRWLLLHTSTPEPKLNGVLRSFAVPQEQVLKVLVDTALLEDNVSRLLVPLVANRAETWLELQAAAAQAMDDLAVYFSGEHALRRNVRNEELEGWFRGLQARIQELAIGSEEGALALGRQVKSLCTALEEVEDYHDINRQPHVVHFLSEARSVLQRMVRTVNLSEETLHTITCVADLSYAWKALGAYQQQMHRLLAQSPDSVRGLRALFVKLASILEVPLRRIRQAGTSAHSDLVSGYYSTRLVDFMRSVLQEIPRLIFGHLGRISDQSAARTDGFGSRAGLAELQGHAQRGAQAQHTVALLTQQVALLMRGIREAEVAVLGEIHVDPRAVLVDGLRWELRGRLEALFATAAFPPSARGAAPARRDLAGPLAALAAKAAALQRGFEHVQDYLGVSALQLWHAEASRVVAFLLQMEEHALLRRRLLPAAASPHHDERAPIAFPDAACTGGPLGGAGSFVSRTAAALLALSDPKVAAGGLRDEWHSPSSGELLLDGQGFELLHRALGPQGVAALSRYLGLRAGLWLRRVAEDCAGVLTAETRTLLLQVRASAEAGGGGRGADGAGLLRAAAKRLAPASGPVAGALAAVGQHQLLRRRLHGVLRVHAKLDAPLALEALQALNSAGVSDALDVVGEEEDADAQLPSVLDFVGEGGPSMDEQLAQFHRRLAAAGERAGLSNPLRQLYVVVPQGAPLQGYDVFLALTLISTLVGQAGRTLSSAALCAGAASFLQHLPAAQTDGVLSVLGLYIEGLCSSCVAGKQAWAEAESVLDLVRTLAAALGLPPERLAAVVPRGVLDLWFAV